MSPNFCVITTTYKRPTTVLRCLESVTQQTCQKWRHIIVIDDPESDYAELATKAHTTAALTLIRNEKNRGKNAAVNTALARLAAENFVGHIIFLDDDDWLDPDCLSNFISAIAANPNQPWLVANRTDFNSKISFTKNKTGRTTISYLREALLTHTFSGDATHCLFFPPIAHVRFPTRIKNAEEWLYFADVARTYSCFLYTPFTGTYSEGYAVNGLTDLYHARAELKSNAPAILNEVWQRKLVHPFVLLYTISRLIRRYI